MPEMAEWVGLFLNFLTSGHCRERKSICLTDLNRKWRVGFNLRVNSSVVTSILSCDPVWRDGLVVQKQAVAPEREREREQRRLEAAAAQDEARRRPEQVAVR